MGCTNMNLESSLTKFLMNIKYGSYLKPIKDANINNSINFINPSRAKNKQFVNRTIKEGQSVVQFNTEILDSDQTIGKILQQAGYTTGFVGKNHVVHVDVAACRSSPAGIVFIGDIVIY